MWMRLVVWMVPMACRGLEVVQGVVSRVAEVR